MTRFECTLKQRFSNWGPRTKGGPRRVPTGSASGFRKVVIVCTFFNNLRPICFQIFGGEFGARRRLRGLDMQRGRDATGGVEGLRAAGLSWRVVGRLNGITEMKSDSLCDRCACPPPPPLLMLLLACAASRHRLRLASATDLPGTVESVDFTEEVLQWYRQSCL